MCDDAPYIIGRGILSEGAKVTREMITQYHWMDRYSNYCKITEFEYLNTAFKNCISLFDVIERLRTDTYITSQGTNRMLKSLRGSHMQKSHLRFTQIAKDYIDKEFDKLVDEYGSEKR